MTKRLSNDQKCQARIMDYIKRGWPVNSGGIRGFPHGFDQEIEGVTASVEVVEFNLSELVDAGKLVRHEDGCYVLPGEGLAI